MKKPERVWIHFHDSGQPVASEPSTVYQAPFIKCCVASAWVESVVQAVRDASASLKEYWAPMHILIPGSQANGAAPLLVWRHE